MNSDPCPRPEWSTGARDERNKFSRQGADIAYRAAVNSMPTDLRLSAAAGIRWLLGELRVARTGQLAETFGLPSAGHVRLLLRYDLQAGRIRERGPFVFLNDEDH